MRLAVLASGEGTTLQALIDAQMSGATAAELVLVISNNAQSGALRRAAMVGVGSAHLSSVTHANPIELDGAILATLLASQVEFIVLTGYLRKIGPQVLAAYRGRIINTHPSLLPRHGGQGMYGRRVHEAVLASGDVQTGVSIHVVDAEYDTGKVIAQATVPLEPGETVTSLTQKVQMLERQLLCATVDSVARENGGVSSNPSIERTSSSKLRLLPAAAHVER